MTRAGLLLIATCGCSSPATPPTATAKKAAPAVEVWGALREMIHEGRIEQRVAIATVAAKPNVFALGAVTGMQGEVTIIEGTVWIALGEKNDGKAVMGPTEEGAALLVASSVPAWKRVTVAGDIPFANLDRRIEEAAASAGIDVEKPFAFLVEGTLTDVRWHVLKGPPSVGDNPHDHAKNAVVREADELKGTAVGFFSKRHQGVFTHMGQNTHAHVVDVANAVAAHADQLSIRAGSTIAVPAAAP